MSDLIDRQAVIDAIDEYMVGKNCASDGTMMARLINELVIKRLPSAQPKRGKWIIKDDTERFIAQCNCCRYIEDSRRIKNYCPNCGADMRGEQDG